MTRHHEPSFMTGVSLLVPITLSTMAIVLLAPILPQLLQEYAGVAGHEYWVPMVLTIPALCVAVFSPVAGILGDWFGRRRLLLLSFFAYAAVGVMPVFLTNLTAILVSRVGVGISEALIMVLTTTMIGDYFHGPARDRWLAAQTAFASLSALVFFNIGGQLGQFGWRTPFWVYASALAMFALVLVFTWEPASDAHPEEEADHAPHNARWEGFPWRAMAAIIAITIYGSVFFYTVQIQAPRGLYALGVTNPAEAGFLTSIASIGVPIGTIVFSRVVRWPIRRLLAIEFAMLAVGFTFMGLAQSPAAFLAGCFVNQLGAGLLLPTLLVWAMSLLPFAIRGRGAGMWTGAFSLGQFLSPIAVQAASDAAGGLIHSFLVLAAGAGIGLAVSLTANFRRGEFGEAEIAAPALPAHG